MNQKSLNVTLLYSYQNQKEVAAGIKRAYQDVPGLKREDIFITGKLWNNKHRPEEVAGALDDSLEELGLDYLDVSPGFIYSFPRTANHSNSSG